MRTTRTGREVAEATAEALRSGDLGAYGELLAPDAVETRRQIGERFVGRDRIVGMYRGLPSWPRIAWRTLRGGAGTWVAEGVIDYGEGPVQLVVVLDVREGRVRQVDVYFAPAMPPPPYHARWAERL